MIYYNNILDYFSDLADLDDEPYSNFKEYLQGLSVSAQEKIANDQKWFWQKYTETANPHRQRVFDLRAKKATTRLWLKFLNWVGLTSEFEGLSQQAQFTNTDIRFASLMATMFIVSVAVFIILIYGVYRLYKSLDNIEAPDAKVNVVDQADASADSSDDGKTAVVNSDVQDAAVPTADVSDSAVTVDNADSVTPQAETAIDEVVENSQHDHSNCGHDHDHDHDSAERDDSDQAENKRSWIGLIGVILLYSILTVSSVSVFVSLVSMAGYDIKSKLKMIRGEWLLIPYEFISGDK